MHSELEHIENKQKRNFKVPVNNEEKHENSDRTVDDSDKIRTGYKPGDLPLC
jgi:hypothetical protein